MNGKKVALIIAYEGFQQLEYHEPKRLLEEANIAVTTVSTKPGSALAKDGSPAHVQVTLNNLNIDDYSGIVFVGGPGALDYLDNQQSYKIIRAAYEKKKIIGAICIATRILANAGILKDKKATGWNADSKLSDIYIQHNAHYVPEDVVIDGTIITAVGPNAATQFGQALVSTLLNQNGWG